MYEIGCAIIFAVDLLEELSWLITDLLNEPIQEVLPRYRARCFFRDLDSLWVYGDDVWNCIVLESLMSDYGCSQ